MRLERDLPERMRAVVQHGPRDLRVEEIPLPRPGPGDVLVRVRANGLCGSDLHFWKHATYGPGVVLGHEVAGEIAAVGEDVAGLRPGDTGAVHTGRPCGRCDRCRDGLAYYCKDGLALGTGRGNGGLAEYVCAPADLFLPAPPGLDLAVAAFAEPLANGLRALERPEAARARSALVIGAGPIGLVCLAAAKRAGVAHVVAIEGRARRRAAALALGADEVVHPTGEDVAAAVRRAFGHGPELVIEAVGLPETIDQALRFVRPRGTVLVMGVCLEPVPLRPMRLMLKELSLCSSLGCERPEHRRAVDLLARGEVDARGLVTRRVPLEETADAMAALATGADEIKVVVEP